MTSARSMWRDGLGSRSALGPEEQPTSGAESNLQREQKSFISSNSLRPTRRMPAGIHRRWGRGCTALSKEGDRAMARRWALVIGVKINGGARGSGSRQRTSTASVPRDLPFFLIYPSHEGRAVAKGTPGYEPSSRRPDFSTATLSKASVHGLVSRLAGLIAVAPRRETNRSWGKPLAAPPWPPDEGA